MQTLGVMLLTITPHLIPKFNKLAKLIAHPDQIPNLQQHISHWINDSTGIKNDNHDESQSF
jgi:hypothetical protein